MTVRKSYIIDKGEDHRVVLPEELVSRMGGPRGEGFRARIVDGTILLEPGISSLKRIYIELTNRCNLLCPVCMRGKWSEEEGFLPIDLYRAILEGASQFPVRPTLFFGGLGEPFFHPDLREMITAARSMGSAMEIITNGTLLDENWIDFLVEKCVQTLWVSIDTTNPDRFAELRGGADLLAVIDHLKYLQGIKARRYLHAPVVGVSFTAMRKNLAELPEVISLALSIGISRFSVSNLLPYSQQDACDILYDRTITKRNSSRQGSGTVDLPFLDVDLITGDMITRLLQQGINLQVGDSRLYSTEKSCPFFEKRSVSIRWDGCVAPCIPLLHKHVSILGDHERVSNPWIIGSIREQGLKTIWEDKKYLAFRKTLSEFDFSPCADCNSCEMAESNHEDCFGNHDPACGGCLWAHGYIRCP